MKAKPAATTAVAGRSIIQAAVRVLAAEEALMRAFAVGLTCTELAKALKIATPSAHRILKTLAHAGRAERIEETDRWRSSHRMGRLAIQSAHALDRAIAALIESRNRIDPDHTVQTQTY
jgi:DNA-binding IclR family transcriptional regulator